MSETANDLWAGQFRKELVDNILPFWMRHAVDRENGGFYGLIDTDGNINKQAERAAVINTRILWTFSAASRLIGSDYRETADWAFDYVTRAFWDRKFGGLFWTVDHDGEFVSARKQIYAQAFGIYAFAEYFRATDNAASLDFAKRLFWLIEDHSYDADYKGYFEARDRDWHELEDQRLSEKDLNSPKSMNTHLHIMEGYTNLLRVWRDPSLMAKQSELLRVTMDRIIDSKTGHFKLFFDEDWTKLSGHISYGHDIEGSWLIVEAAEVLGDAALIARAREMAVAMARAVYEQGLDGDGSLFYEADAAGKLIDAKKHWWAQAEGVIGFYNAFQLSGDPKFLTAARRLWDYIESKIVDRAHGEWQAKLSPEGRPLTTAEDPDACLAGPWKCPYHNARVCFEMMARLQEQASRKNAS
ncbi:MAG: AGE family epimerase/isomerase [Alphaproteobacteria bacterium]|nr:AGE family epimerase/isomerase [Alphaproteobacteria bacterium]MDE2162722.1 AGE family epimerase/isomerase [Alphaproteobacteria bacterium]MDE2266993.1 AGE family epimerase/isomerase [Alphaproteobacteria bacterium]MDE2501078.1 AGE family epimerase/isomerase [Alphaproteobacteria bacterium]